MIDHRQSANSCPSFSLLSGIVRLPFCQITHVAYKAKGDLLTCPWGAIKLCFLRFIQFANFHGPGDHLLKIHYLSSNPNTTGSNCFFLDTTPGASRVPSARGG